LIVVDTTHVQFASSLANAIAGTAINLTGAGSGTNTGTHTGTARTLGEHGGEQNHALVTAEIPSHTHAYNDNDFGATSTAGAGYSSGNLTAKAVAATGGSGSHNNMQPYVGLNHIIKV
jgi:microcystin-dependent protein